MIYMTNMTMINQHDQPDHDDQHETQNESTTLFLDTGWLKQQIASCHFIQPTSVYFDKKSVLPAYNLFRRLLLLREAGVKQDF